MKILFIVLDALRYDYYKLAMPNLQKIGSKGIDCEQCYSTGSNTAKSIPGILSGTREYDPKNNLITDLNKQGIHTSIIFSNPVLYRFTDLFKKSVDIFNEENGRLLTWIRRKNPKSITFRALRKTIVGLGYLRAENTTKYALSYLERNPKDSFTWVHYMDPHIPWEPVNFKDYTDRIILERIHHKLRTSKYKEPTKLTAEEKELIPKLYLEECRYLDSWVEVLFNKCQVDKIIITSDHGDLLGEYGHYSHPGLDVPELRHVPMILSGFDCEPLTSHSQLRELITKI